MISEPVQLRLHTPVRPQQKNGERNLWEMVCDLRDGELHIPYHQREFVWPPTKCCASSSRWPCRSCSGGGSTRPRGSSVFAPYTSRQLRDRAPAGCTGGDGVDRPSPY